jgi:hypothetical protein
MEYGPKLDVLILVSKFEMLLLLLLLLLLLDAVLHKEIIGLAQLSWLGHVCNGRVGGVGGVRDTP